jgi:hypothetical protein
MGIQKFFRMRDHVLAVGNQGIEGKISGRMPDQRDLEPARFVRESAIRVGRKIAVNFQEIVPGRFLLGHGSLGIAACLDRRKIHVRT